MRPLSVAMLSHLASPHAPTGAERSLALLAAGLAGRGHRVMVVTPSSRWVLAEELRQAGVEVFAVPSRSCWLTYWEPKPWPLVMAKAIRYAWPTGATRRIALLLAEWNPDVVHINCLPHLRAAAAARHAGIPAVWHLREILPPGPRRRFFARRLSGSGAQIVAVSRAVADWVSVEGLADRVRVVYNGVPVPAHPPAIEDARREFGLPPDGTLAGYIGQLVEHKGVLVFLEAAFKAMALDPSLRFLIAGDGPPAVRGELRQHLMAARAGGGDRVTLLSAQPQGDRLMAACDIVCVPTLTPDPLPRSVMEAMALGRLVVASASGGIPELLTDARTGFLVRPGDSTQLAETIVSCARDPLKLSGVVAAARAEAEGRFSIEAHIEAMESNLHEISERQDRTNQSRIDS